MRRIRSVRSSPEACVFVWRPRALDAPRNNLAVPSPRKTANFFDVSSDNFEMGSSREVPSLSRAFRHRACSPPPANKLVMRANVNGHGGFNAKYLLRSVLGLQGPPGDFTYPTHLKGSFEDDTQDDDPDASSTTTSIHAFDPSVYGKDYAMRNHIRAQDGSDSLLSFGIAGKVWFGLVNEESWWRVVALEIFTAGLKRKCHPIPGYSTDTASKILTA